jgi:hypothetical protein
MKADIINTNFIFEHKLFKFWKILFIIYGILLIYHTASGGIEKLYDYESTIKFLSNFFVLTGFLLFFANSFMFSRIGELIIKNNNLIIEKGKLEITIDLNKIDEVTFGKWQKNFYYIKLKNEEICLELKNEELIKFKETFEKFNIKINHRYLVERIIHWLRRRTKLLKI